jgi:hypothetical protein
MTGHDTQLEILTKVSQKELSVDEAVQLLEQTIVAQPAVAGWDCDPRTESFHEALHNVESAAITLNTHAYPVEICPLKDSPNLVEALLQHRGIVDWSVEGDTHRRIVQTYKEKKCLHFRSNAKLRWHYGLSPLVPLELDVDSGSGSMNMNLHEVQLRGLSIDSGSGSVNICLPQSIQPYEVRIDSGSGSIKIDIPHQTNLKVIINSGSGSVNIRLPKGCEFRAALEEHGSGSFNIPAHVTRTGGTHKKGVWQTCGYENAANHIEVVVEQGSGSFNLHCSQN